MDMATYTRESALNRKAFERLRDEIRSRYAGIYVVLSLGKVIGADVSFDAAYALANEIKPTPEYYLVFQGDAEPDFGLALDLNGSELKR